MGFTPEQQRDFIKMDLGPALHSAGYGNISLMILDDVRIFIITWAKIVSCLVIFKHLFVYFFSILVLFN